MNQTLALVIGVLLVVGFISYFVNIYNGLVVLKNNVSKAFSNIDVILKQRADEIPNVVAVVKKFMQYESEILEKLTLLRTNYNNASSINDKVDISSEMGKTIKGIFAVSENYPELKSNANFLLLQQRISQLEDKIADRREFFNDSVNLYNIGIATFPDVIFAKLANYKEFNMLAISETEKQYNGVQL